MQRSASGAGAAGERRAHVDHLKRRMVRQQTRGHGREERLLDRPQARDDRDVHGLAEGDLALGELWRNYFCLLASVSAAFLSCPYLDIPGSYVSQARFRIDAAARCHPTPALSLLPPSLLATF